MDINVGLEAYHRQYDVVHVRLRRSSACLPLTLSPHQIQRLTAFIQDVADCLRPGGLGAFIEWDYQIYTPEHVPFTSSIPTYDPSCLTPRFGERAPLQSERLPALVHLLRAIFRASTAAGSHVTGSSHLGAFVQRNGEFKDITVREVWIPVVPKPGTIRFFFVTSCESSLIRTSGADRAEQNRALEFRSIFMVSSTPPSLHLLCSN